MDLWLLLGIIAEILQMKGEHGVIQWTRNFAGSIATFHHVQVSIRLCIIKRYLNVKKEWDNHRYHKTVCMPVGIPHLGL